MTEAVSIVQCITAALLATPLQRCGDGRRLPQPVVATRFETARADLRWIVPPGAYQPAFFRTAGAAS